MSRFVLEKSEEGLRLTDTFVRQNPLLIDFSSGYFSHRLKNITFKKELIARAVGAKSLAKVLDCTGGLGRDAFLLASLGCCVTMIERSQVLALLLEDALKRALRHPDLGDIAMRINLLAMDARHYLSRMDVVPDVIILDPMFPDRKKSAKVKGDMQIVQRFLGKDEDVRALFDSAMNTQCPRVVMKRPLYDKSKLPVKPTNTMMGSSVRFDIFIR